MPRHGNSCLTRQGSGQMDPGLISSRSGLAPPSLATTDVSASAGGRGVQHGADFAGRCRRCPDWASALRGWPRAPLERCHLAPQRHQHPTRPPPGRLRLGTARPGHLRRLQRGRRPRLRVSRDPGQGLGRALAPAAVESLRRSPLSRVLSVSYARNTQIADVPIMAKTPKNQRGTVASENQRL